MILKRVTGDPWFSLLRESTHFAFWHLNIGVDLKPKACIVR